MDELIEYLKSHNISEVVILGVENRVEILISDAKIKGMETAKEIHESIVKSN